MNEKVKIPYSEIKFSNVSNADYGKLFTWNGRLFRGIYKKNTSAVKEIFDTGLIQELIEKKYFIKTWISDQEFETFDLVLEHEIVKAVIYPREWTFSMLKDSALLVLNLNEVAKKYGFKTIDCHTYNILFKNSNPIYVDFGSFQKSNFSDSILAPYHEFIASYIYPLRISAYIGPYFGRHSVLESNTSGFIPTDEYIKIFYPFLRRFSSNLLNNFFRFIHIFRTLHYRDLSKINERYKKIFSFILKTKIYKLASGPAKISKLKKYINQIMQHTKSSYWANYQYDLSSSEKNKLTTIDHRFLTIEKKLLSLNVKTVTEIAGNQGAFSILISRHGLNKIICIDSDSHALNLGYLLAQKKCLNIDWATLNPFGSNYSVLETPPFDRLRSELVVALALTHHLILSQHIRISKVMEILSLYTSKNIIVEFMPLGLYNGINSPPVPSWYNIENFSSEFSKFFKIIEICNLEKNRILFIGEKL
jgi:hypothetical protein